MSAVSEFRARAIAQGRWDENGNRTPQYIQALIDQSNKWVNGVSIHNSISGECCLDFSCCHPDMLMPYEKRVANHFKLVVELEIVH